MRERFFSLLFNPLFDEKDGSRRHPHFASRRFRSDSRTDAAHAASTFALQRMVRLRAALVPARLERAVPTDTATD